jgi:hypothetical protein
MEVSGGVAGDAYMIDLIKGNTCSVQTVPYCPCRKTCTMLFAIETFFLYGRDKLTIFYDRGRGIAVVCIDSQGVQRKTPVSTPATPRLITTKIRAAIKSGSPGHNLSFNVLHNHV